MAYNKAIYTIKYMPKKCSLDNTLNLFNITHNNIYDYSKVVYLNNIIAVEIICCIHGSFWQLPLNHKKGSGCPKCAIEGSTIKRTRPENNFISLALSKHNKKYDYSKIIYKNLKTKLEIVCPTHGSFWQLPECHLRGQGCKECSYENRNCVSKLKAKNKFLIGAKKLHKNKYIYAEETYKDIHSEMKIVCPTHGEFFQTPYNHMRASGCRKCSIGVSFIANQWLDGFNNKNIIREYRLPEIKSLIVDGYDHTTKTIYEFYGDYWHGNPNRFNPEKINTRNKLSFNALYLKTITREKLIQEHGYTIISIWESDYLNTL